MTRTGIAAIGIAVTLMAASPAALAHGWPGSEGMLQLFETEVPAGALPPGGAVAELRAGASRYRVRFEMPSAGPARVSLWNDVRQSTLGNKAELVATSDRGGTFRTIVEALQETGNGPPLFLESADQLAAFSRAASLSSGAKELTKDIALGARAEIAAPDCRRLGRARFVVAVLAPGDSASGLLACAARGAQLVIVGRLEAAVDPDTRTFARLVAGHGAVAWGYGAVAWLPDMRADVADAIVQVEVLGRNSGNDMLLGGTYGGVLADGDYPTPKGVPGSTLVLVLLALYVAVIGPIGYFVGVRPRRAWLAWSWFPMVALAATIALAAVSALWRGKAAALTVNRVSLIAPTGAGLEGGYVRLQGSSAAHYSISLPWRDGDLRGIDRNYRFGSPFSPPAGSLVVTDDRTAGRLRIDGLAVGRHGSAGVNWTAAADRSGAEVSAGGGELTIINRSTRPLRRAVVRVADRCGAIAEVPAGAARTVSGKDCGEIGSEGTDEARAWPAVAMTNIDLQDPARGSFLIAAESDDRAPDVVTAPAVRVRVNDVVIIRGPVARGGSQP